MQSCLVVKVTVRQFQLRPDEYKFKGKITKKEWPDNK